MKANEAEKSALERRIFEALASVAGMRVVPKSISQKRPPVPDIECELEFTGPLAVELVALDADITQTRLSNMFATEGCWLRALSQWPRSEQEKITALCADMFLGLQIGNEAGTRQRTNLMKAIQEKILAVAPDFEGQLFEDFECPDALYAATVHRGRVVNGPRIIAPSTGRLPLPQVGKIEVKLREKKYVTDAPLELFAYAEHDDVDGHLNGLALIEACIKAHLPGSRFRRVWVFNLAHRQLKYCYP